MSLLKFFFPKNESFGYEAMRAAGYSGIGAADLAEVVSICSRIPSGNEDIWLEEWRKAADRAVTNANTSLAKGNKPSARDSFLRASNYYRTAEFYRRDNPFEDDVSRELAKLGVDLFHKAAELMPYVTTKVKIPYEDTTLPAIWMRPDDSNTPRPTLLVNGGYDSTKEETVYSIGAHLLQLGFNVLAFEGPGQGEALRLQRLFFRYDWEKVITPIVDYMLAQPFVDASKLAIMGISMGGYLVARATAFEHRFSAVILNNGLFDFGEPFRRMTPALGKYAIRNGYDGTVSVFLQQMKKYDTGLKWGVCNGKWVFGLDSEVDVLRVAEKYTLAGGVAEQIKTPTMVLEAADDHFFGGQPKVMFEHLTCEKEWVEPTREEGGTLHCHMGCGGRLNQIVGDWLLEKLSVAA